MQMTEALRNGGLPDGKYTVNIIMKKAADPSRRQESMANRSAQRTVLIEVAGGQPWVYTKFNGMNIETSPGKEMYGFLGQLSYYVRGYGYNRSGIPQGNRAEAEVLSRHDVRDQYNQNGELYPKEVKFPIVDLRRAYDDSYIPLHVFVPIMEAISRGTGDQDVLMQFEWNTLHRVDGNTRLSDVSENRTAETGSGSGNQIQDNHLSSKKNRFLSIDEITSGKKLKNNGLKGGSLKGLGTTQNNQSTVGNGTPAGAAGNIATAAQSSGVQSNVSTLAGTSKASRPRRGRAQAKRTGKSSGGLAGLSSTEDSRDLQGAGALSGLEQLGGAADMPGYEESSYADTMSYLSDSYNEPESVMEEAPKRSSAGRMGRMVGFWSAVLSYLVAGGGVLLYRRRFL